MFFYFNSMVVSRIYILLVIFSFSIIAIARSNDDELYFDDLSIHRDKYKDFPGTEVLEKNVIIHTSCSMLEPVYHTSNALLSILNFKKEANLRKDKVDCYTIQVYAGGNRSIAFAVLEGLNNIFQDGYVQYIDSNYIVRVGKCIDKLELCDKYVQMLKLFPNIIIRSVIVCREEVFFRSADSDLRNDDMVTK